MPEQQRSLCPPVPAALVERKVTTLPRLERSPEQEWMAALDLYCRKLEFYEAEAMAAYRLTCQKPDLPANSRASRSPKPNAQLLKLALDCAAKLAELRSRQKPPGPHNRW